MRRAGAKAEAENIISEATWQRVPFSVGWGALIPGREKTAPKLLDDSLRYLQHLQQIGVIDSRLRVGETIADACSFEERAQSAFQYRLVIVVDV